MTMSAVPNPDQPMQPFEPESLDDDTLANLHEVKVPAQASRAPCSSEVMSK